MPPKVRKAAAPPKTRANATSSARSTRGRATTATPAEPTPTAKKTRGAKSEAVAPATTAAAAAPAKGRRGRKPKQQNAEEDAEVSEAEQPAPPKKKGGRPPKKVAPPEPEPESESEVQQEAPTKKKAGRPPKKPAQVKPVVEVEAPNRGRGRAAKAAAPAEPEVEEEAPKRGRGKAAVKTADKTPATPSKRTRRGTDAILISEGSVLSRRTKRTIIQTPSRQAESVPAPKKRGRAANNAVRTMSEPPKKGRKSASKVAEETPEPPKRRGRAAKAAEEPADEEPSKNGRKSASKAAEEAPEPPKKRGRAAKAAEETADEEPPKKRGRPAAKTTTETSEPPKKRGRVVSKTTEPAKPSTTTGRKGRGAGAAKATKSTPKRRGGAVRTDPIVIISPPDHRTGAKRGRPDNDVEVEEEPARKRRGPAPKAKTSKATAAPKATKTTKPAAKTATKSAAKSKTAATGRAKLRGDKGESPKAEGTESGVAPSGHTYWLMKAEPESRVEKGKDIKFSIDDLAAATEPELWDGVRNHVAKNNMKAMKKGDLAFFYHSNCKDPGIVGIMEIVEEAQPDESAFDPAHPYYDEKSSRANPTWYCVKVGFRSKFGDPESVNLRTIKSLAGEGSVLADMQLVKLARLSVTKVSKKEWDFILKVAGEVEPERTTEAAEADAFIAEQATAGAIDEEQEVAGQSEVQEELEEQSEKEPEQKLEEQLQEHLQEQFQEQDQSAVEAPKEAPAQEPEGTGENTADFSEPSEPEEPMPDDDALGLTIGTPKGAAALLNGDASPSPIERNEDTSIVTQDTLIIENNNVVETMEQTPVKKVPARAASRQPFAAPSAIPGPTAEATTGLAPNTAMRGTSRQPSHAPSRPHSRAESRPPSRAASRRPSAQSTGPDAPATTTPNRSSSRAPSVTRSVRHSSRTPSVSRSVRAGSAPRGARGSSAFGNDHTFALDTTLEVDDMSFEMTEEPSASAVVHHHVVDSSGAGVGDTSLFSEGGSAPLPSVEEQQHHQAPASSSVPAEEQNHFGAHPAAVASAQGLYLEEFNIPEEEAAAARALMEQFGPM